MLYRKLVDADVSILGFGCMRLPILDGDHGKIDEEQAFRMLDHAIENGVNYLDTAWPYHKEQSEPFVGKYLKESGNRDKIYLATKLPSWHIQTREDCDKYLNDQLERLQTDHIDFYLIHALNKNSWGKVRDLGIAEFLETAKSDGRIGRPGFSYHDESANYNDIADGYDWTFSQILYNHMDEDFQAGVKGLDYAKLKGIDIIAMEPLRGGKLTKRVPKEIRAFMDEAGINMTPAELALRWVWNNSKISLLLSGMSAMDQAVENVRVANYGLADSLTDVEREAVRKIRDLYRERTVIDCTDCGYCQPCPMGVAIPRIFSLYNDFHIYGDEDSPRSEYSIFMDEEAKADKCGECRECEEKCPQQLTIVDYLKACHKDLSPVSERQSI